MTTREENIKRINAELEKLTDEELDWVAGGNLYELADDGRFLNVLLRGRPGQCDRYGEWRAQFHMDDIAKAWASVGIAAKLDNRLGIHNKYYLDGKQISRDEAMEHAEQVVGKHLDGADWYW